MQTTKFKINQWNRNNNQAYQRKTFMNMMTHPRHRITEVI